MPCNYFFGKSKKKKKKKSKKKFDLGKPVKQAGGLAIMAGGLAAFTSVLKDI